MGWHADPGPARDGPGPLAGGRIHDAPGTYRALFLGSFAIGTMAIVLGLTVRAPGFVGGRPNRAVGG